MPLITPADYRAIAERHEGRVAHMYLDTVGVVTIGIGHALRNLIDAGAALSGFGTDAIIADWDAVKAMPAGRVAAYYAAHTHLRLSDAEIDALFERDCREKIDGLADAFYAQAMALELMPAPVQLALLDMAFNLGVAGLTRKWPKLMVAVKAHDWRVCAAECKRPQLSADRNDWTHGQFMLAAALLRGEPPDYRVFRVRENPAADLAKSPAPAGECHAPQPAPPGLQLPPSGAAARAEPASPGGAGTKTDPAAPESLKPLSHSRTIAGATVAAGATGAQIVAEHGYDWLNTLQEWTGSLGELSGPLNDLAPFVQSLKIVVPLIALAGVAVAIYARWHDRRYKGH